MTKPEDLVLLPGIREAVKRDLPMKQRLMQEHLACVFYRYGLSYKRISRLTGRNWSRDTIGDILNAWGEPKTRRPDRVR